MELIKKLNNNNSTKKLLSKYKGLIWNWKSSILLASFFPVFSIIYFTPVVKIFPINSYRSKPIKIISSFNKDFGKYFTEIRRFQNTSAFDMTRNLFSSLKINEPSMQMNIKFNDFSKLNLKRNQAISDGYLIKGEDDYVKGEVSYKGNSYPVRIRLKGDITDHLEGTKWSYRLKGRKGEKILGMSEFSLMHPKMREYVNEFIFHKLLKYQGLPYLRYKFIPLKINGTDHGIYAIEEHFSKEAIENSNYRESVVLKVSESELWRHTQKVEKLLEGEDSTYLISTHNSEIKPFNLKSILRANNTQKYNISVKLLDDFLTNKKTTSQVFEISSTAKYLAILDLLSSSHPLRLHNLRFYYNPISARLLFYGFDAIAPLFQNEDIHRLKNESRFMSIDVDNDPNFGLEFLPIFSDVEFTKAYIEELEKIVFTDFLDNFLNENKLEIERSIKILHKSYPYVDFSNKELFRAREYLRYRLNPNDPISIKLHQIDPSSSNIKVQLANKSKFPIAIESIQINEVKYKPNSNIILDRSIPKVRMKYTDYDFTSDKIFNKATNANDNQIPIVINYRLYGSKIPRSSSKFVIPIGTNDKFSALIIDRIPNMKDFDFIRIDEKSKTVIVDKGSWLIDKPLIIPRNYSLKVFPGANLSIKNKGIIFSEGPVILIGSKDLPISINGYGEGMGLVVINSIDTSYIDYVNFKNITVPRNEEFSITGAVTFFNSPVKISNSKFKGIKAEDALNIFRSPFSIVNTSISQTFSDGLDIDFSDGSIKAGSFSNIGNDGLDISGSKVEISETIFSQIPDKAISVGENSILKADNINVMNSGIGIASKDNSKIYLKSINLNKVDICFSAFQKKTEYGPAQIYINSTNIDDDCKFKYLLEKKSSIILDDKELPPNSNDVRNLMYGNEYGKATERF
tara:strand:+ start:1913 stop:4645 length:2733 start_codon:yes stop_codon:yes gene_type:complete